MILSRTVAQTMFPGEDPIANTCHDDSEGGVSEVIGVVADTRWYVTAITGIPCSLRCPR